MKVIFVHCFLLISTAGICQFLQGNWNIGQNLRLTFLENGIEIDTSSSMLLGEGSVTFSDVTGNLMFYTDGQSLWNAQHDLMPNGTGLAGGLSSTQACLTVPEISNNSQFYLFTTTATGTPLGLTYSKIDMDLDGGSGDVISSLKNIVLDSSVSEKLIGISKCDKSGYWVLAHDAGNNQLLAYEIGTSGLNTTPVISYGAISTLPFGSSNIGYLKASFDGSIIAMAHFGLNKLEIMQFDRQTGLASNPIVIPIDTSTGSTTSANFPYGIEISP